MASQWHIEQSQRLGEVLRPTGLRNTGQQDERFHEDRVIGRCPQFLLDGNGRVSEYVLESGACLQRVGDGAPLLRIRKNAKVNVAHACLPPQS